MRNVKVTYENGWEYMDIHVELPVPYEENYQIKMLGSNKITGLLDVKGSGIDGHGRYTFRVGSGNTMLKEFTGKELKKEDISRFTEDLAETVDALREYLLDPDSLLLSPELVVVDNGTYRFCYLPVSGYEGKRSLCSAFHSMTEYFVKNLDYQDTAGVFLACKMHKETMKESYELRKIMESCTEEEKAWKEDRKRKRKSTKKKNYGTDDDIGESFSGTAVFTVNEEDEETKEREKEEKKREAKKSEIYQRKTDMEILCEEPAGYGPLRRAVNRIRTGRWGQWEDLITEMDGQDPKGHI